MGQFGQECFEYRGEFKMFIYLIKFIVLGGVDFMIDSFEWETEFDSEKLFLMS